MAQLDAKLTEALSRLATLEAEMTRVSELAAQTHELLGGEIRAALRAIVAEEAENRRKLTRLRESKEYAAAFTDPEPLVTVTVVTSDRPELLSRRSLPSILTQSYERLEVIVVGDHAATETEEAVRSLGDPRVVYRNLTHRLQFTDDPYRRWLVASTMARNEAYRLAHGRWIVCFDDDDALRPGMVARLLEHARRDGLEAVYGLTALHSEGAAPFLLGSFPPELGKFTWAAAMHHAGLRFLDRQLFAADLGLPGDWFLAERMLRAGVRFGMLDEVLADIYPAQTNDGPRAHFAYLQGAPLP